MEFPGKRKHVEFISRFLVWEFSKMRVSKKVCPQPTPCTHTLPPTLARESPQLRQLAYLKYIHLVKIFICYLGYIYPNQSINLIYSSMLISRKYSQDYGKYSWEQSQSSQKIVALLTIFWQKVFYYYGCVFSVWPLDQKLRLSKASCD